MTWQEVFFIYPSQSSQDFVSLQIEAIIEVLSHFLFKYHCVSHQRTSPFKILFISTLKPLTTSCHLSPVFFILLLFVFNFEYFFYLFFRLLNLSLVIPNLLVVLICSSRIFIWFLFILSSSLEFLPFLKNSKQFGSLFLLIPIYEASVFFHCYCFSRFC